MNKFQKIGQFRNAVYTMKKFYIDEIVYCGTIKLHGTNGGLRLERTHTGAGYETKLVCQSRNNDLKPGKDNCGFRAFMEDEIGIGVILEMVPVQYRESEEIVIYGEWAGRSIQKGVGVSQLPKMFVVFDVKVNNTLLPPQDVAAFHSENHKIYNIYSFPSFFETVNINDTLKSQEIFSRLTQIVEKECPVAKQFGKVGIGEGIVWRPIDAQFRAVSELTFKTKGEKHSASKVKTIAEVTPEMLERSASIREFIEYSLTENRLKQGLEYLREDGFDLDKPATGRFLSWIVNDITTEEADIIEKQGFTRKEINAKIGTEAREWFFAKIDES